MILYQSNALIDCFEPSATILSMGNKDARKRETRKPKKKLPKQAPKRRDDVTAARIASQVTGKS